MYMSTYLYIMYITSVYLLCICIFKYICICKYMYFVFVNTFGVCICREHNRSRNLIEPKETRERSCTDSDHKSYMNSGV